jgi:hypothetical protein
MRSVGSATGFSEVVVCGRRSNQAIRVESMLKRNSNDYATLSDSEFASRIAARDVAAVRLVTGRNNQRLFCTAWSILKDRSESRGGRPGRPAKSFRRHRDLCRKVVAFNMAYPKNCRERGAEPKTPRATTSSSAQSRVDSRLGGISGRWQAQLHNLQKRS